MGKSYTNTKRKGRKTAPLQQALKLVLYLGAIAVSCIAAYTAIKSFQGTTTTQDKNQFPHGSIKELLPLRAFMPAYLAVNCKEPLLETTHTIQLSGTIDSDNTKSTFVLLKQRPDRLLFTLDLSTHEITYGVYGQKVWRRIRVPKQDDIFSKIQGEEAETWLSQAHFYDRIIEAHLGNGAITAIQPANWQGSQCLKVIIQDVNGKNVETFIDLQTMHPIAERHSLANGSVQLTEFSNFQDTDDMPIPFNIITSIDGKVTTRIQINNAGLNTGIMSRLFEVPSSLL